MTEQEQVIFDRIAGHSPAGVKVEKDVRGDFEGLLVLVYGEDSETVADFFFPDYAGMSDADMAEVVANNLREEKWNSLRP